MDPVSPPLIFSPHMFFLCMLRPHKYFVSINTPTNYNYFNYPYPQKNIHAHTLGTIIKWQFRTLFDHSSPSVMLHCLRPYALPPHFALPPPPPCVTSFMYSPLVKMLPLFNIMTKRFQRTFGKNDAGVKRHLFSIFVKNESKIYDCCS